MVEAPLSAEPKGLAWRRWSQLALGVACLVAIANLQYGWTLFINPIDQKYGWGTTALQWTFTIAIATETFLAVPFGGRLVDRFGPKLTMLSGPLVAIAWAINSKADALILFYAAAVISGVSAGLVFAATYGNALKWFPDRRGLATGLTAAGFAGGGAITVVPLDMMIRASGYEAAYVWFGLGQGVVVLVCASLLRPPRPAEVSALAPPQVLQGRHDRTPLEALRSQPFWLMYAMFVMVGASGLVLAAQLAPIAAQYGIDKVPVSIFGLTVLTPAFAVAVGQVMNGLSRPVFGAVSDRMGRETTMFVAFMFEAGAVALMAFANTPISFVLGAAMVFFAWGQIFSLFPAICADTYGSKFVSANYGILYTAKGVAALLVPLASVMNHASGSWTVVFVALAVLNALAALLVLALTPARRRLMAKEA